jgi:hypothetical protein
VVRVVYPAVFLYFSFNEIMVKNFYLQSFPILYTFFTAFIHKNKLKYERQTTKSSNFLMTVHTKSCIYYTVPKAFSMHETFPKLLGKISKTTWKY